MRRQTARDRRRWGQASAGGATIWTPDTPGAPIWWHSAELGRVWQDTAGTIAAVSPGDPVARIDARYGTNFTQSSPSLQPFLTTLGSRLGVGSDDVDDNVGHTATLAAGAKTLGAILAVNSAPSSTGAERILQLGATPAAVIVRHSGLSSSSAKGFHFGMDRTSSNAVCIQPTGGAALLSTGVHTLVIRYDGSGAASASAYRAWLDGVEVSLTTGGNVAASGNTRWLATSVASEVFDGSVGASILWDFALGASDCASCAAYLEAMR